ncbi:MAG: acyltransferase domain-containing protein [bacterium]|nr:acyltransferase domain-containing protein [bacterium]
MTAAPDQSQNAIAFAFPGVGTGLCGHEPVFFERYRAILAPFLQEASDFAGADFIAAACRDHWGGACERTKQFFAYAFGCGAAAVARQAGVTPRLVAGYSLGVYAALVAAESLSFTDGLTVIDEADRLMVDACAGHDYGMAAVVGLDAGELDGILSPSVFPSIQRVNVNNPTSHIFAGDRSELIGFVTAAQAHDAYRALMLDVEAPYHHPAILDGIAPAFERALRGLNWNAPVCPVVSSIDQALLTTADQVRAFTARNIATPIHWERVVETFAEHGIARVVECGAGISLTQNARMLPDRPGFPAIPRFANVKNWERRLSV